MSADPHAPEYTAEQVAEVVEGLTAIITEPAECWHPTHISRDDIRTVLAEIRRLTLQVESERPWMQTMGLSKLAQHEPEVGEVLISIGSPGERLPDEGVYADIRAERARQDAQWGGPEHDDRHIISDWRDYRQKFEHRASVTVSGSNQAMRRDALVKIAALAVAQVEALDREHPRASLSPERSSRDR